METIIIVSVLATLGVVAILTSIVVAFIKLRNKVDVNDQKETIDGVHQLIEYVERKIDENQREVDNKFDRLISQIYETLNNNESNCHREFESIHRTIDSRCDKLDSKIKAVSGINMPKTDRQILND
jgi:predicted PurR-regulated permease PerM